MKKVFITGRPGVGKSTVLKEVITILKNNGFKIGGITCPEIRKNGKRIGFEIIDIASNNKGILASMDFFKGPMVGKYYVNLEDLEKIAIPAIKKSIEELDLTVIDEIGPMELKSKKFYELIMDILKSNKSIIAIIHKSLVKNFSIEFPNIRFFEVNEINRIHIAKEIANYFMGRN
ncbi:MAG: NTPase [Candidatus Methanomethylicaceae archaeon]|nr:NTPase [Candidatus Verstraetearchaeota archaeon]